MLVLEKINVHAEHKTKEKANGFASTHHSFQKMILSVSSIDGMDSVEDPATHCKDFQTKIRGSQPDLPESDSR